MATYIIKRLYSSVRNPYLERVKSELSVKAPELLENNNENPNNEKPDTPTEVKNNELLITKAAKVNKYLNRLNKSRNTTPEVKNININKTTNVNNQSKLREAELNTAVKMAKLQQDRSSNVNEKLIELQKTNPLKPISMNGGK